MRKLHVSAQLARRALLTSRGDYFEPGRFIHHSVNEVARPALSPSAKRMTQRLSKSWPSV